jgi:hypothetical protein
MNVVIVVVVKVAVVTENFFVPKMIKNCRRCGCNRSSSSNMLLLVTSLLCAYYCPSLKYLLHPPLAGVGGRCWQFSFFADVISGFPGASASLFSFLFFLFNSCSFYY